MMNRRRRCPRMLLPALAVLLLEPLALTSLHAQDAQTVYAWHEPGGTVVYSQLPPRAAAGHEVHTLHLHVAPAPQADEDDAAGAGQGAASQPAQAGADPVAAPVADRAASGADINTRLANAQRDLRVALRNQRLGDTPLPGERQHLVNGHSRLTNAYFERLAALQAAVTNARAELHAARAAANEPRLVLER